MTEEQLQEEPKMQVYTRRDDWSIITPEGHPYREFVSLHAEIALALIDPVHNLYTIVTREFGMDVIGYDEMQIIQFNYNLNV
jgi:hypothetical protein